MVQYKVKNRLKTNSKYTELPRRFALKIWFLKAKTFALKDFREALVIFQDLMKTKHLGLNKINKFWLYMTKHVYVFLLKLSQFSPTKTNMFLS